MLGVFETRVFVTFTTNCVASTKEGSRWTSTPPTVDSMSRRQGYNANTMARISQTYRKLREAQFFYRCLYECKDRAYLLVEDAEEFDFYVSAFLSAGRSVTFVLQAEHKELYDAWFDQWLTKLDRSDRELMDFMNTRRVAELHQKGLDLYTTITIDAEMQETGIGKFFGRGHEVWATCRRYLTLLEELVREFTEGPLR